MTPTARPDAKIPIPTANHTWSRRLWGKGQKFMAKKRCPRFALHWEDEERKRNIQTHLWEFVDIQKTSNKFCAINHNWNGATSKWVRMISKTSDFMLAWQRLHGRQGNHTNKRRLDSEVPEVLSVQQKQRKTQIMFNVQFTKTCTQFLVASKEINKKQTM